MIFRNGKRSFVVFFKNIKTKKTVTNDDSMLSSKKKKHKLSDFSGIGGITQVGCFCSRWSWIHITS